MDRFEQLLEKIEAETALSFAGSKRSDLMRGIENMAAALGMKDASACSDWLLAAPWDLEKTWASARHLTVRETYFFREPRAFNLVCDYARKKIASQGAGNSHLRIWSAGCCTGEEAYSIAMALQHSVPQLQPEQITILATDINRDSLAVARAGIYRQWSFRGNEQLLLQKNFQEDDAGQFHLAPNIRQQVQFNELNLAVPDYPSIATGTLATDIIFCRNVLMYFSKEKARQVIARFRRCLVDGGWLIVSPSEASAELFTGFSAIYYPDAIFFQKTDNRGKSDIPLQCSANTPQIARPVSNRSSERFARTGQPARFSAGMQGLELTTAQRPSPAFARKAMPARTRQLTQKTYMGKEGSAGSTGKGSVRHSRQNALLAIEAGAHPEAIQHLRQILYLQPHSIIANYLMGVVRSSQSRPRDANRQFELTKVLLAPLKDEEVVPESDGLSAAYLRLSVQSFLNKAQA